jgi:glycerol-3-phosphate dehydrogenase
MTASPATPSRSALLTDARQKATSVDVLVIGAGINGIATFRDLALNGVSVLLVDRGDFCSGASAASSHMIHGGIRYLENGEFRLVKESVHERNALLRLAPHYVRPLPTTIPIFSTFSSIIQAPLRFLGLHPRKRRERGALIIKAGLTIYDLFSRDGGRVPRHQFRGARASRQLLPELRDDVRWTATYYDASMHDPERLALDVLTDGLEAGEHAQALNYVEAVGMDVDGAVSLRDVIGGETWSVHPSVVVNASGPWTDLTNDALGETTHYMGGTKGSHIVLDHPELLAACAGREIFFEFTDGRIVLIYPLKGRVLVGTTDLPHDMGDPVVCTEEEVDYFFGLIRHVFPGIEVDRGQIVFRFSGVRPLPRQDAESTGQISRDYHVESRRVAATTVLSLIGGKWTTFRALGEQLSDRVLALLGRDRGVSTDGRLIGGAVGYPTTADARLAWSERVAPGIPRDRVETLLDRYGTSAEQILRRIETDGDEALDAAPGYSRTEILHLIETERVVRLSDIVLRRTSMAFIGEVAARTLAELAELAAAPLGWDAGRIAEEIAETAELLREKHGVTGIEAPSPVPERTQQ